LSKAGVFLFCIPTVRPVNEKRARPRAVGRMVRSRETIRERLNQGLKMKEKKPRKAAPTRKPSQILALRPTMTLDPPPTLILNLTSIPNQIVSPFPIRSDLFV